MSDILEFNRQMIEARDVAQWGQSWRSSCWAGFAIITAPAIPAPSPMDSSSGSGTCGSFFDKGGLGRRWQRWRTRSTRRGYRFDSELLGSWVAGARRLEYEFALTLVVFGFIVLSSVIAVKTPPWQSSDEPEHVRNIETLVSGHWYGMNLDCRPKPS